MTRSIGFDGGFLKSRDGVFKIIQFCTALVVLILISTTEYWRYDGFEALAFATFTGSFSTVCLLISLIIYLFKLYNIPLISKLPWWLMEMIFTVLCALLYIITVGISGNFAAKSPGTRATTLAIVAVLSSFLFIIFLLYGFVMWRNGEVRSQSSNGSGTGSSVNT